MTTQIPSGERAERKRRAIVAAAREVFIRDGYEAGMDLIAAEANVSKVTIYNHFGSKEALFTAVIRGALDEALGATLTEVRARFAESDDLRETLLWTAREWVRSMTTPQVRALRNLVAGEVRRFPELGRFWQEMGPGRFHPVIAGTLRDRVAQGTLAIPDIDVAVIQYYALVLYPHLVHTAYGVTLDADFSERLTTTGVDMFLTYYGMRQPAGLTGDDTADGGEERDQSAPVSG
ncbi:TetR/AcrR family transcriptional regulator [Streptosporangium sp. NPDC000396]|uniref:TetR/AcrR family transcriptional regulator n=1 Tax=Streptosporangium sp. NPDC000396 TaxID=3366185 RepID=UPI0036BBAB8C